MGTRLREASEKLPKPLVDIGGKPILWHIMKLYGAHGFRRFVLCLGYKGPMIKRYFLDYYAEVSDFTLHMGDGHRQDFHGLDRARGLGDHLRRDRPADGDGARVARRLTTSATRRPSCSPTVTASGTSNSTAPRPAQDGWASRHGHWRHPAALRRVEGCERLGLSVAGVRREAETGRWLGEWRLLRRRAQLHRDYLTDDADLVLESEPLQRLAADGQLSSTLTRASGWAWTPSATGPSSTAAGTAGDAPWKLWKTDPARPS
jgi:glucose-1-phosphate cytidylyltransferase